jgi:hypothetical protein
VVFILRNGFSDSNEDVRFSACGSVNEPFEDAT